MKAISIYLRNSIAIIGQELTTMDPQGTAVISCAGSNDLTNIIQEPTFVSGVTDFQLQSIEFVLNN